MSTKLERQRREFIEQALHRGWATAPKSLVTLWFEQQKFSKGIAAQIEELATNAEEFGTYAAPVGIFETEMGEILLVRAPAKTQWKV
jgi:hypothetical protein